MITQATDPRTVHDVRGREDDLRGEHFGELVVIKRSGTATNRNALWLCRCECGRLALRTTARLRLALRLGQSSCCLSCQNELRSGISISRRAMLQEVFAIQYYETGSLWSPEAELRLTQEIAAAVEDAGLGWHSGMVEDVTLAELVAYGPLEPLATGRPHPARHAAELRDAARVAERRRDDAQLEAWGRDEVLMSQLGHILGDAIEAERERRAAMAVRDAQRSIERAEQQAYERRVAELEQALVNAADAAGRALGLSVCWSDCSKTTLPAWKDAAAFFSISDEHAFWTGLMAALGRHWDITWLSAAFGRPNGGVQHRYTQPRSRLEFAWHVGQRIIAVERR